MKKTLFFSLLFLFLALFQVQAAHIEQTDALSKAKGFFQNRNVILLNKLTKSVAVTDSFVVVTLDSNIGKLRSTKSTSTTPAFYIFNRVNGGFVIVAAEDCVKSILGYSDEGTFSSENMPENITSWLNFYTNEIEYAKSLESTSSTSASTSLSSSVVVSPLLGSIKWNQGTPYNDSCPSISSTQTVTGCVATAMAQIMKYYEWPVTGTGSNSYTPTTSGSTIGTLSVDFSATTYDWDNMLNSYSSSYSTTEAAAVAQLMYHCGVAVNMDYGTSSSGASIIKAGEAFATYFGYDSDVQTVWKDLYSYSDWKDLIKNELDNGGPVFYSGQSTDGGHAFVCDGYDSDDLFHINWGWAGTSDGYFELSALNPQTQGVGGSTGGYSEDQIAVINIQKPDGVTSTDYEIGIYGTAVTPNVTSVSTNSTFSISYGFLNYGLNSFSGNLGLALYQNGSYVKSLYSAPINDLAASYGLSSYTFSSLSLSGVANGTYQIYAVYLPSDSTDWSCLKKTMSLNNYVNVTISGSTATFSLDSYEPTLELTEALSATTNLYKTKTGVFEASITNTGTTEFNSNLAIYIYNSDSSSVQYVGAGVVDVPVGETVTTELSGTITLDAGTYSASLVYDEDNDGGTTYVTAGPTTYSPISITINDAPSEAVLSATNVTLAKTTVAQYDTDTLTATVANTGGYYDSYISVIVTDTSGVNYGYLDGYDTYLIDNGQSVSVKFGTDISYSPGAYYAYLCYYNSGWHALKSVSFTVVDPTISVSSSTLDVDADDNSTGSVDVTSNTTWVATSDEDWLTISGTTKSFANAAGLSTVTLYGNATLTFTAAENTTGSSRTANVVVADNGSTSETIVVTQEGATTGISEFASNIVTVSPNPATNYFVLNGVDDDTNVFVTDVSGKLVLQKQIQSKEQISVEGWSKGVYLVKVNNKTLKLVVK